MWSPDSLMRESIWQAPRQNRRSRWEALRLKNLERRTLERREGREGSFSSFPHPDSVYDGTLINPSSWKGTPGGLPRTSGRRLSARQGSLPPTHCGVGVHEHQVPGSLRPNLTLPAVLHVMPQRPGSARREGAEVSHANPCQTLTAFTIRGGLP